MERDHPTKWDLKREASYEALVRSAMHSFHAKGYAATTVDDVIAGTGYTAGAFYHHFANKTECFWHVVALRERLRGDWASLAGELDPATTSLEQVLERVFAHFSQTLGGLTEWVLVMVDFYQQHRADAHELARLAETYRQWRDGITRFVQILQEGGWIGQKGDPTVIAQAVFAFVEGMMVHGALYGRSMDPATLQRIVVNGVVSLLRASDGS